MLRTSLRLLPLCTVALVLATGCNDTPATDGGGTGTGTGSGSGTTTGGGSTTTGGGSTTGAGSTSGGTSSGGTTGGVVDAGCGPSGFHCPAATPLCDPADGGTCVQCSSNQDCTHSPGRPICIQDDGTPLGGYYANKCAQCQTSDDCVSTGNTRGPICDTSGQALALMTEFTCGPNCLDGGTCDDPKRAVCSVTGLCVGCQSNADCPDPIKNQCDRVNGSCVQCFNNGDCTGTSNSFGPTSFCFHEPSGLPSSANATCVGCLTVADCNPPDWVTSFALEGPTTACNTFDHACEKACILPKDCKAGQVKTVCRTWTTDPGGDDFCGCDPAGTPSGCGGEAPFCIEIQVPAGDPRLGFCSCSDGQNSVCGAGLACDLLNYPAGACRPYCNTGAECTDLPNSPFCFADAGLCVGCLQNSDCDTNHPICDPASFVCRAPCGGSQQCPADQPICNSTGTTSNLCYQCQAPPVMNPPPTGCPHDKLCSGLFTGASGTLQCE